MDFKTYKTMLNSQGNTLAQIKKNQSNNVINNTFTNDPNYKKVYILGHNNPDCDSIISSYFGKKSREQNESTI